VSVRQHLRLAALLLPVAACHAPSSEGSSPAPAVEQPAPKPTAAPEPTGAPEDATVVRGTVEAIRMQNINKARDHFTYNVEIELRHEGIERAGTFDAATVPNPLVVRVDKVPWSALSQDERDAVAPDGPQAELSPGRWKDLEVGKTVELNVTFTSASLAQRVR
jgi:hypothetical protein